MPLSGSCITSVVPFILSNSSSIEPGFSEFPKCASWVETLTNNLNEKAAAVHQQHVMFELSGYGVYCLSIPFDPLLTPVASGQYSSTLLFVLERDKLTWLFGCVHLPSPLQSSRTISSIPSWMVNQYTAPLD
ncbi:hypothetical protein E1B28_012882 [Marasmius oreades]|uniref:Uncharacterized protein n=1 Tax=Marasmius oreades TaxID=181124 RepID=A0A9P7UNR1_9AGAR|nr:uncharacterized protein E1B28_012882 [Marasmius oreades]KAG7088937.1 hypothetical protein E1B28_012882 [Marasmius oreades]